MYSLTTAINYIETASCFLAVSMLMIIGFLYIRVKWYYTRFYIHIRVIKQTIRYAEINGILLLVVLIGWFTLHGLKAHL